MYMYLALNDVQILCNVQGLLYHNYRSRRCPRKRPPKHDIATTSLRMTYCTLREQLFAWKMVYPETTIGVMNDKL